jgi:acyl carrier protein phosphodiesterase
VSEVTDLINSYKAGELTLDELAQHFRARQWPVIKPPPPSSYLEMAARAQEDPRPRVPNSFDDVKRAYSRGDLTREEYDVLAQAVQEAARADQPDPP